MRRAKIEIGRACVEHDIIPRLTSPVLRPCPAPRATRPRRTRSGWDGVADLLGEKVERLGETRPRWRISASVMLNSPRFGETASAISSASRPRLHALDLLDAGPDRGKNVSSALNVNYRTNHSSEISPLRFQRWRLPVADTGTHQQVLFEIISGSIRRPPPAIIRRSRPSPYDSGDAGGACGTGGAAGAAEGSASGSGVTGGAGVNRALQAALPAGQQRHFGCGVGGTGGAGGAGTGGAAGGVGGV